MYGPLGLHSGFFAGFSAAGSHGKDMFSACRGRQFIRKGVYEHIFNQRQFRDGNLLGPRLNSDHRLQLFTIPDALH